MEQTKVLAPLFLFLLLASTATPALARKVEKAKIEYALLGSIWDIDQEIGGTISLAFSGRLVGTPDHEYEDSGVDSGEESWDSFWEEYWENETGSWKAEVYLHHEGKWADSYSLHEAKWYSPQPKYNGKLVSIWQDGSTATFRVDLNPFSIERSAREGISTGEAIDNYTRLIYLWDEKGEVWVFVTEETYTESWTWSYTYAYSMFHIAFSGKVQTRGTPPLEGTFLLWDYKSVADGKESHSVSGDGKFGPYTLSVYM